MHNFILSVGNITPHGYHSHWPAWSRGQQQSGSSSTSASVKDTGPLQASDGGNPIERLCQALNIPAELLMSPDDTID